MKALRAGRRGRVALNRALSKLGILSRAEAIEAIRGGRVTVNGRLVRSPQWLVEPERARIEVDGDVRRRAAWRTILFHKPRGVITTRRDPEGRPTVFDVIGDAARSLVTVGRLDAATTGLLMLTSDTRLANWVTDPRNQVARVYVVTVRGRVEARDVSTLMTGVASGADTLRADQIAARKISGRESHLTVELREGKNREVRRLFEAIGHEVTRLKRIQLGGLQLGSLAAGNWRELTRPEITEAFPGAPVRADSA